MTVDDLLLRVSSYELSEWMAHDELTVKESEHAQAAAQTRQAVRTF